jgi:hypothetical protein
MDNIIAILVAIAAAMPWIINWWITPFLHRRSVAKARRELAAVGLTPERYLATLDPKDYLALAEARYRLGLERNADDQRIDRR